MKNKDLAKCIGAGLVVLSSLTASAASLSPVVITDVSPAADGSDNLVVSGRVDQADGIVNLDVNGYPTQSFDGEQFSLQLPPAANYHVNLYSFDGSNQTISYAAPDAAVDSAIQVVIGDQVMRDVGGAMGRLLADLDLNAVLGINPNECVIDTWFLRGCDFYLREMAIEGTPDIELFFTPDDGEQLTMNIGIDIPQAVMSTQVKRSWWWGYYNTEMTTQDIRVSMQIGVEATDNQSIRLILNEPSDIQMHIGNMRVHSNSLAAHMIPLFKDGVTKLVNRHVVNVIGPLLGALPIPSIPIALPLDIDGDGVNDAEFDIKMNAELLDVLASGDGQAVLAGSISSALVAPGREVLGSRRIASQLPGAEAVQGTTDLTAAVSTNLVNQIMTALYQSGIEEKLTIPMTVADLGSFGAFLPAFGYQLDDNLNIALKFGAAPELQVNNDSQHPLGLEMIMPQMQMVMSVATPDGEDVIIDLVADFGVATSLGADPDGQLYLELNNLLAMNNVAVNGGVFTDLFPPEQLAPLIGLFLPQVINEYEPMINELLNVARLELDIGAVLSDWLATEFPSVPVAGYVTETGVSDDESYLQVGVGLDFP